MLSRFLYIIGTIKNDWRLKVETQLLTAVLRCGYQPYRRQQAEKAARTVPVSYFLPVSRQHHC